MESLHILIVEDEPLIAKDLAYMLEDLDYKISGIAYNANDALKIAASERVDLAILDINIEGDVNGIALASKLDDIPFIYLTSHSSKEIVAEAKKTEPLAYLVKPIDEHDLLSTIDVAFYNYQKQQEASVEGKTRSQENDLFIKSGHSYIKVKVKDILYVEANDNYCFIHSRVKKFLLSQTLKAIETRLSPFGFMRVHRSFLINPNGITSFSDVSLQIDKITIPISRKYKRDLKARFDLL